jgi:metal transporter CNNM
MADIAGGLVGFIVSTIIIVLFGEVIPQALCSRHALVIGEKTIPLVRVIQFLMYPFTKPLAFMLDKLLGHELGTTYSKAELNKLLEIHVKEGRFTAETGQVMTGALNFHDKLVRNIMTPLSKTFMLNVEEVLDFDCIAKIFKAGYSRIPVYDGEARNIIGLLFVKDLIFVNPDDGISVKNFVNIFGRRVHVVWVDDSLGDVLRGLKQGNSHMALVRDVVGDGSNDNTYEIVGIIT